MSKQVGEDEKLFGSVTNRDIQEQLKRAGVDVDHRTIQLDTSVKALGKYEVIVRLVELDGQSARNVRLKFAAPVVAAREINGQEQPLGAATISKGELITDFSPYQLHTFAVKLAPSRVKITAPQSQPVALPYDASTASSHGTKAASGFDAAGRNLPAEMLPRELAYAGIRFSLAPSANGQPNALIPRGQTIPLPAGKFTRLYILAASAEGDQRATFRVGNNPVELMIQHWGGFIGQWDNRQWLPKEVVIAPENSAAASTPPRTYTDPYAEMTGIRPGSIKRAVVAWFASHHHTAEGVSEPYAYSYLFAYAIDLPANAKTLMLPNNDKLRLMAVSVTNEGRQIRPVQPLYDTLDRAAQ